MTTPLFEKNTAVFAYLIAFGIAFLMGSARYYFESIRYEIYPPKNIVFEIEKAKINNFGVLNGYLELDVILYSKTKPHNQMSISIPITKQADEIKKDVDVFLFFQKLNRKGVSGKPLWRVQTNHTTIVNEREMINFQKNSKTLNFRTFIMLLTISIFFFLSAFLSFRRMNLNRSRK